MEKAILRVFYNDYRGLIAKEDIKKNEGADNLAAHQDR